MIFSTPKRRLIAILLFTLVSWGLSPIVYAVTTVGANNEDPGIITKALAAFIELGAQIGLFFLGIISNVLGSVVTVGSFVTNPIVTSGWPFLQGIANFGFILALLVIAVTTALRVDIGGGARRLLPRLLLGAILLNFSLLIGGLIIDASRLLMALFANILGPGGISDLGGNILRQSSLVNAVYEVNINNGVISAFRPDQNYADRISFLLAMLKAAIFVWGLMIGMLVITVTLIIRYIMLLLLLIVSPLVYVAIAFPGAGGLATMWWKKFLREVFYGPVAIFALVILGTVGAGTSSFNSALDPVVLELLGLIIMIVMLMVVATSGRRWGATGADKVLNATRGTGNFAGRVIRNNPKTAATLLGYGLGGIPAAIATALATRGLGRSVTKAKDTYQDYSAQRTKDKEKRRKQEAKISLGTKAGKTVSGYLGTTKPALTNAQQNEQRAARAASARIGNDPVKATSELKATDLLKPHVIAGLSTDAYKATLDSDSDQTQALISGTLSQKDNVNKEQAQAVTIHLVQTINNQKEAAQKAAEKERNFERESRKARAAGNIKQAEKFQEKADEQKTRKEEHTSNVQRASTQLKTAVRNKAIVDKLDDATKNEVIKVGEKAVLDELNKTLTREDK